MNVDVTIESPYRLKLSSKKLKSGMCQVKFEAQMERRRDLHGYVLVESSQTLKYVVSQINLKLTTIQKNTDYQHIRLYSIGRKEDPHKLNFLIFES